MRRLFFVAVGVIVTLGQGCAKPVPVPEPGRTVAPTVQTAPPAPPPNIPPPTPVQPNAN
ncbi:MAG TPA: hypothetical protein VN397_04850 [Candidatus Methylomirabilis sp.]|nr:hypothetical protein [Candidatus Methylomirabilis sp.]